MGTRGTFYSHSRCASAGGRSEQWDFFSSPILVSYHVQCCNMLYKSYEFNNIELKQVFSNLPFRFSKVLQMSHFHGSTRVVVTCVGSGSSSGLGHLLVL